LLIKYSD